MYIYIYISRMMILMYTQFESRIDFCVDFVTDESAKNPWRLIFAVGDLSFVAILAAVIVKRGINHG